MSTPEIEKAEDKIAENLGWAMDNMTRIMRNPVDEPYVQEKLRAVAVQALKALEAMGVDPAEGNPRESKVDWDLARVLRKIGEKAIPGGNLHDALYTWHEPGSGEWTLADGTPVADVLQLKRSFND